MSRWSRVRIIEARPTSRKDLNMRAILLASTITAITSLAASWPTLDDGEIILLYGNSMVDRLQDTGVMEAYLQLAQADKKLQLRSLAYAGDELGCRVRPVGYKNHLRSLLKTWPSKTLIAGFGMNESFAGPDGLPTFRNDLQAFVDQMTARHPGARIVFLSPIAMEPVRSPHLPDAAKRNADIALYADAMQAFCESSARFFYLDLFVPSQQLYAAKDEPLTVDGIHLNDAGSRLIGAHIGRTLTAGSEQLQPSRVAEIAKAVADKSAQVEILTNTLNGVHLYGVRKRDREYDGEMPVYEKAIALGDSLIWKMAAQHNLGYEPLGKVPFTAIHDPAPNMGRVKPLLSSEESAANFAVADGFAVNLFASEKQFPDLQNPLQMRFDAKGRLWVNVIPSYPAFVPGTKPNDKILIFTDKDGDGRADSQTVFASSINMSCGFTFHRDGVVVIEGTRALLLKDTDGDDKADVTEELFRGFDHHDSHHGGMPTTDPFGHVFLSEGVFERTAIETPWGVARSDNATRYRANLDSRRVNIEWSGGAPNPWKITFDDWGSVIQYNGGGQVMDISATPWSGAGMDQSFRYEKGCGMTFISSPHFPDAMQGDIFACHLLGRSYVSYTEMGYKDGRYAGTKGTDLLTSQDGSFRPTDAEFGLDGALYINDFYNAVIGHLQHETRAPYRDHSHGRIWRVVNTRKPLLRGPQIEGASIPALLKLLEHPQFTVRQLARLELARQPDDAVATATLAWMRGLESDRSFLEGLWTLCRHHQPNAELTAKALNSGNPRLRAAALQILRMHPQLADLATTFTKALQDPELRVQVQAVRELSFLLPKHPELRALVLEADDRGSKFFSSVIRGARGAGTRDYNCWVPVLNLHAKSLLKNWLGTTAEAKVAPFATGPVPAGTRNIQTYVESRSSQKVFLTTFSGLVDIAVNDAKLFSANGKAEYTYEIEIPLNKGANQIRLTMAEGASAIPKIYLQGKGVALPPGVDLAADEADLLRLQTDYRANFSVVSKDRIRLGVIDGALKFNVDRFTVKAGVRYKLSFSNTGHMEHNLVIGKPGSYDELAKIATELAAHPRGRSMNYIPRVDSVIFSTPQLAAGRRIEKRFTAPKIPGEYPYLCTFPGHFLLMRGVMVVE
jgi:glucose/arabinose dehydrogenase/azurin